MPTCILYTTWLERLSLDTWQLWILGVRVLDRESIQEAEVQRDDVAVRRQHPVSDCTELVFVDWHRFGIVLAVFCSTPTLYP